MMNITREMEKIEEQAKLMSILAVENRWAYDILKRKFDEIKDDENWKKGLSVETINKWDANITLGAFYFFHGGGGVYYDNTAQKFVVYSASYYDYIGA